MSGDIRPTELEALTKGLLPDAGEKRWRQSLATPGFGGSEKRWQATGVVVPKLFVDVRPARVDGEAIGASNPRIVFVHGAMDRSTSFARLQRCFPQHTTVAYDRRGYAKSVDVPAATNFSEHVQDLLDVVGDEPSVIVGHSLGGVIALTLAATRPELVLALMIFEAPMPWTDWWPGNAGGSTIAAGAADGPAAAAESFMRRIVGDEIWERLGDKTRNERRAEGEALLQDLLGLRVGGSPYDVAAIKCPVVVGYGAKSQPNQQRSSLQLHTDLVAGEANQLINEDQLVELTIPNQPNYDAVHAQFLLRQLPHATHGAHSSAATEFAELIRLAMSLAT